MSGDRGYRSPYAAPDHARAQFIEALRRAAVAEAERDEARHELIVLRAGIRKPRRPQKLAAAVNRDHGRHHFTATGETRVYSGVPAVVESCTLCGHRRLRPLPEVPGCGHCLAGRHDRCRTCECCSCLVSR